VALLRYYAGGAHSNSPWRCILVTAVVFLSISIAASNIAHVKQIYIDGMALFAIAIGTYLTARLAPVDSPAAPIVSATRRALYKRLAVLIIVILSLVLILLRQSLWLHTKEVQVVIIFSILWVSLNLTNLGHRLASYIDQLNSKTKEVKML